jgi:probable phosphoglycerate mutase
MATIFLIRHALTAQTGRVLYGQTPRVELDERGRAQAVDLVARFDGVRLTAIYASPLERCAETVSPLARARHIEIRTEPSLIEMDAGSWTGRSLAQLRRTRAWRTVQREPSAFAFPGGGESFPEAQERAVAGIERIARRHRAGSVAVATHGDIVRIVLAHFAGAPLDLFQRIVVDTASVSVVQLDGGRPHVLLVNDTGGLRRFAGATAPPWEAAPGRGRGKVRG